MRATVAVAKRAGVEGVDGRAARDATRVTVAAAAARAAKSGARMGFHHGSPTRLMVEIRKVRKASRAKATARVAAVTAGEERRGVGRGTAGLYGATIQLAAMVDGACGG